MDEYTLSKNQRHQKLSTTKRARESGNKKQPHGGKPNAVLAEVYADTVRVVGSTKALQPKQESVLFDIDELGPVDAPIVAPPMIEVCNMDTLEMAKDFCGAGLNPLVINMASDYRPGGGVASGKVAQEECIFRRTNACATHPPQWYPLEKEQVIYSPQVSIVKDADYKLCEAWPTFGMLAVAAIRKPKLNGSGTEYKYDADLWLMTTKIESIFKIALQNGHDSLVLGALGCGVFKNPPVAVAQIFKDTILRFGGQFKRIGFAVLTTKPKEQVNFDTFSKIMSSR